MKLTINLGKPITAKLRSVGWEPQDFVERAVFVKFQSELRNEGYNGVELLIGLYKHSEERRNTVSHFPLKDGVIQTLISERKIDPTVAGFKITEKSAEFHPRGENPVTANGVKYIEKFLGKNWKSHLLFYGPDLMPKARRSRVSKRGVDRPI